MAFSRSIEKRWRDPWPKRAVKNRGNRLQGFSHLQNWHVWSLLALVVGLLSMTAAAMVPVLWFFVGSVFWVLLTIAFFMKYWSWRSLVPESGRRIAMDVREEILAKRFHGWFQLHHAIWILVWNGLVLAGLFLIGPLPLLLAAAGGGTALAFLAIVGAGWRGVPRTLSLCRQSFPWRQSWWSRWRSAVFLHARYQAAVDADLNSPNPVLPGLLSLLDRGKDGSSRGSARVVPYDEETSEPVSDALLSRALGLGSSAVIVTLLALLLFLTPWYREQLAGIPGNALVSVFANADENSNLSSSEKQNQNKQADTQAKAGEESERGRSGASEPASNRQGDRRAIDDGDSSYSNTSEPSAEGQSSDSSDGADQAERNPWSEPQSDSDSDNQESTESQNEGSNPSGESENDKTSASGESSESGQSGNSDQANDKAGGEDGSKGAEGRESQAAEVAGSEGGSGEQGQSPGGNEKGPESKDGEAQQGSQGDTSSGQQGNSAGDSSGQQRSGSEGQQRGQSGDGRKQGQAGSEGSQSRRSGEGQSQPGDGQGERKREGQQSRGDGAGQGTGEGQGSGKKKGNGKGGSPGGGGEGSGAGSSNSQTSKQALGDATRPSGNATEVQSEATSPSSGPPGGGNNIPGQGGLGEVTVPIPPPPGDGAGMVILDLPTLDGEQQGFRQAEKDPGRQNRDQAAVAVSASNRAGQSDQVNSSTEAESLPVQWLPNWILPLMQPKPPKTKRP